MKIYCNDIKRAVSKIDSVNKKVDALDKKLQDRYDKEAKKIYKLRELYNKNIEISKKRVEDLQRKISVQDQVLEDLRTTKNEKVQEFKKELYERITSSSKYTHTLFDINVLDIIKSRTTSIEKFQKLKEVLPSMEYKKFKQHHEDIVDEIESLGNFYKENITRYAGTRLSNIKKISPDMGNIRGKRSLDTFKLKVEKDNMWKVEKTYVKLVEYISTSILYFLMKNRPLDVLEILRNYSINTGTKVCELDTKEGVFYIEPELKISIRIIEDNYEVLKNFKHPMNIIYNRSIERIDDFVINCTRYTPLLDLNLDLYKRIICDKLDLWVDDCPSFIKKTNVYMKKEHLKNYRRVCIEFEKLPGVYPMEGCNEPVQYAGQSHSYTDESQTCSSSDETESCLSEFSEVLEGLPVEIDEVEVIVEELPINIEESPILLDESKELHVEVCEDVPTQVVVNLDEELPEEVKQNIALCKKLTTFMQQLKMDIDFMDNDDKDRRVKLVKYEKLCEDYENLKYKIVDVHA